MSTIASAFNRLGMAALGGVALAIATFTGAAAQDSVRVIKVATCAECKPLAWGAIGVQPEGYEPELLQAINAKLPQYKFEMEGLADIAQETGLATGKYDISVGGYYSSPQRAKQFLIPESPMGASLIKIYSRKDAPIAKMKELVGKRLVPSAAGGGTFKFIEQWQAENPGFDIDNRASSAGIPYPYRLQEINNGKFDAGIWPSNLGQQAVIDGQKLNLVASEPVYSNNTYMLISRKPENEVLAQDVTRILKELKEDGTIGKLSVKWFGEDVTQYMK